MAPQAAGSGWYGLLDIIAEAADERRTQLTQPPTACPNDGEPLEQGQNGIWHCPFDGFQWPRDRDLSPH